VEHESPVKVAVFSPDGTCALTGDRHKVRIWSLAQEFQAGPVLETDDDEASLTSAAFLGDLIIAVSYDGSEAESILKVWRLPSDAELASYYIKEVIERILPLPTGNGLLMLGSTSYDLISGGASAHLTRVSASAFEKPKLEKPEWRRFAHTHIVRATAVTPSGTYSCPGVGIVWSGCGMCSRGWF
jgi:WD40 repeat protein